MKRACFALMSVLVAVACGSDKQFLVGKYTGPTDPTAPTPVPIGPGITTVSLQGPPQAIGPGETGQMRAIARLTDGSDKDVTADAQWTSSQTQIATVSAGVVTGQALGRVQIRATYQSRSSFLTIVIKPAGTFILSGNITEPGPVTVGAATVSVTNGAPNQVTANTSGFYELFGVSGMVTLRVGKPGYIDETRTVTLMQDQKLDVQIRPISAPAGVAGTYRMTLTIAPSCSVVPDDQKIRIYTAAITQDNALVRVQLSDANFAGGKNMFNGKASGSTVTFDLGGTSFYYYYYSGYLQENLPSGQLLTIFGALTATPAAQTLSGNLVGGFTYREGNRTRSCTSNTNSVVFTRN
jgi:Bacterial Ig-like domain (group 2)